MSDPVLSHIMNADGNWGTSRFIQPSATLAKTVSRIYFAAHSNQYNAGSDGMPPTNHWSMFLQTGQHESVRVEVAPGEPGRPGMILLETKQYSVTNNTTRVEPAAVPEDTTVATIFSLIISKKRDNYVFAPVGEGCRFWLATVAADLADAGIIASGNADRIRDSLTKYWPYPIDSGLPIDDRPMSEGRFF